MTHDHDNDNDRHDHAGHRHGHAHGDGRLTFAVFANVILSVGQIIGGIFAGSIALIADAVHNLSDAASLVIAVIARRIARRPVDTSMTFGYARAETVAALINYVTLILISVWLGFEGVMRIFDPTPVNGWIVVILAGLGLAVNTTTAVMTYAMSKASMNIRAAFLHNLSDALASVGVMVAGTVVILYGWVIVDPLITIAISAYIMWHGVTEVGPVIRVLMLGAPPSVVVDGILSSMRAVPGVRDVHHLHVWQMQENASAVEAHVIVDDVTWPDIAGIRDAVRTKLTSLGIAHITLEMESTANGCKDAPVIGHG